MVSRRGRLVWALAGVLVLVGCTPSEGEGPTSPPVTETSDEATSQDPTSEAPTEGGSEDVSQEPSEQPEVDPPERPAAMEEETVEGAIAAAKYFMELYPYIYATGDLTEWDALSDEGCGFCANVGEQVRDLYSSGGYATGVSTEVYTDNGGGPYSDGVYIVDLGVRFHESTFVDGDGSQTEYAAEDRPEFSISLDWRDESWVILGVNAGAAA